MADIILLKKILIKLGASQWVISDDDVDDDSGDDDNNKFILLS